jgi:hypothetical protein
LLFFEHGGVIDAGSPDDAKLRVGSLHCISLWSY